MRTRFLSCIQWGWRPNRDDWVYDFDKTNLRKKVKFFAKTYNSFLGDETQETNTIY